MGFRSDSDRTTAEDVCWGYLIVWEFHPKKGAEARFEEAYGARGVWAQLFARGEGL